MSKNLNITNSISEEVYSSNAKARIMARNNEIRDRNKVEVYIDKATTILVDYQEYVDKSVDKIREDFIAKVEASRRSWKEK